MSDTTSEARGNGQKRRRSRGGKNRNRNRQENGENPQGRQGGNQGGAPRQGGGGNRNRNRNRSRDGERGGERTRSRAPKPKPLTWWQKLLKAIGLYKEPAAKARPERTREDDRERQPVKQNTRDATSRQPGTRSKDAENPERRRERAAAKAKEVDSRRLYLGNLSYEAGESDLEELFRGVGSVRRVEIVYNRRTHRSKGYGFIEMLDTEEAKKAVEILHDQFFMGRKLVVSAAKSDGPADTDDRPQDADEEEPTNEVPTPAPVPAAPAAEEVVVAETEPATENAPAPEEEPKTPGAPQA